MKYSFRDNDRAFEPLISTIEAAQALRIHPKTLLRMARQGEVPSVRLSRRRVAFRYSQLDQWLASRILNPSLVSPKPKE